jgi:NAD(P) transhydrogenase subunit alpha
LSRNVSSLLALIVADGAVKLDWDDEVVAGTCVTHDKVSS